jgi:DNA-binding IclR family transcriptional regulator
MDQAVSRSLAILEALSRAEAPLRMSRLSEQVGLQKSTVHRILQTLIALGYVEQEADTGRYGASLKLWELGSAIVAEHPVKRAASSFLQALHREVGETVSLLVPAGDDVLYLERLISPRTIRFSARPGSRVPALLTAGGRALLAQHPDLQATARRALAAVGTDYRGDASSIAADLEAIRDRGYSISRDTPGVMSMGCAIAGRSGQPAAAISVSAPLERWSEGDQARVAHALQATCAAVHNTVGLI